MPGSDRPFKIVDADNHYYEPADCFTRFADPGLPDHRRVRWMTEPSGKSRLVIGNSLYHFILNPTFEPVAAPGALMDAFAGVHAGDAVGGDDFGGLIPIAPAFRDRDARLAQMDRQGIETCLMLPTLGITIESQTRHDVEMTYSALHAFNQWLDEDWGFNHQGRIVAPPLVSLLDLDRAVEEIEWVIARGARAVHMQTGPWNGRSPADPYFDPFWARVADADVAVVYHASRNGYNATHAAPFGEDPDPPSAHQTPFHWAVSFGDRGVYETVCALIFHDLFGRFPTLRVGVVELGSAWVDYAMKVIDKAGFLGRRSSPVLSGKPSELLKQHIYVSPFPEEDILGLANLIGSERVMLGSDWPHPEGLAEPSDYLKLLEGAPQRDIDNIARRTTLDLVRL